MMSCIPRFIHKEPRFFSTWISTATVALLLPLISACTAQSWYEGSKASARQQCAQLPPGSYEDCMSRVNRQSYESYEQERERMRSR